MSAKLVDGKSIAKKINEETAREVAVLKKKGITPKLAVILVGADKPSQTYVRKKGQAAEKCGMDFELVELPAETTKQQIIDKIESLQSDPTLSGIIVQLPLPEPLYTTDVLNAIDRKRDVDCLTDANLGKLVKVVFETISRHRVTLIETQIFMHILDIRLECSYRIW